MQELCIINSFDVMLAYLFICPKNKVKILINSRKKCLKKRKKATKSGRRYRSIEKKSHQFQL